MRPEEPEVNLDQILERIRGFASRFRLGGGGGAFPLFIFAIFAVALIVWLATGFYTVEPGEQAALRRLGKFDNTQGPGLHWFWPAPIGTKAIVNVEEVRRLEIGLRGSSPVLVESLMITGDENIVDAQLVVQYDIQRSTTDDDGTVLSAIEQFLFRSADPEGAILKSATESSLRQVVGQRDIDDVLTTEKEDVQQETKELLQVLLDLYQTGIRIREVKLQNVLAPSQVQDAFDDVVRAKEDKETAINLAEAYEADILPRARGEAAKTVQAAEAFKAERIAKATGEASRFLQVLTEFKQSEDVTRQRLYLEAMEDILPGITKFIVSPQSGGNLLQLLPLTGESPLPVGQTAPSVSQRQGQ
jgi:membrane protease subunit HflK